MPVCTYTRMYVSIIYVLHRYKNIVTPGKSIHMYVVCMSIHVCMYVCTYICTYVRKYMYVCIYV